MHIILPASPHRMQRRTFASSFSCSVLKLWEMVREQTSILCFSKDKSQMDIDFNSKLQFFLIISKNFVETASGSILQWAALQICLKVLIVLECLHKWCLQLFFALVIGFYLHLHLTWKPPAQCMAWINDSKLRVQAIFMLKN